MNRPKLVLVHGWGLNSAIWKPLIDRVSKQVDCQCIDLPGYGESANQSSPTDIDDLADYLLAQAPEAADWCGWSLGGMAVMAAARKQPGRFSRIQLLCTTPRFVHAPDWPFGMDMEIFKNFSKELSADYAVGIQKFLLLQAGAGSQARSLAKKAVELISQYPAPTEKTLAAGLQILHDTDLRETLDQIHVPCQVIAGRRDRVVHPQAGEKLAQQLPNCHYQLINSGHAPHLSDPDTLAQLITEPFPDCSLEAG